MGQSESQPSNTLKVEPFNPTVEIIRNKEFNPHYGEVRTVRDTATNTLYLVKEIIHNTKQAYEADLQAYIKRIAVKYPNVVNTIGYSVHEKSNFCSTHYKITIYIELLEKTLKKDLEEHQETGKFYSELEILLIAENLISGLSYFQTAGYSHDDIRPFNIFVQEGAYKLSDPFLGPQKDQTGLSYAIIQGSKTILAPELIKQVPENLFEIKTDRNKADVYSLGVTLLSLGTLTNPEDLYNYKEGTIDQEELKKRLESFRQRYSEFTSDLVEKMLTLEAEARPDFTSLSETLQPFQGDIREGKHVTFIRTTETVKRSHLPEENDDDLEARIRQALERSAATINAVGTGNYVTGEARNGETRVIETTYTYETPAITKSHAPVDVKVAETTTTYTYGGSTTTPAVNYTPIDAKVETTNTYTFGESTSTPAQVTVKPTEETKVVESTSTYTYGGSTTTPLGTYSYTTPAVEKVEEITTTYTYCNATANPTGTADEKPFVGEKIVENVYEVVKNVESEVKSAAPQSQEESKPVVSYDINTGTLSGSGNYGNYTYTSYTTTTYGGANQGEAKDLKESKEIAVAEKVEDKPASVFTDLVKEYTTTTTTNNNDPYTYTSNYNYTSSYNYGGTSDVKEVPVTTTEQVEVEKKSAVQETTKAPETFSYANYGGGNEGSNTYTYTSSYSTYTPAVEVTTGTAGAEAGAAAGTSSYTYDPSAPLTFGNYANYTSTTTTTTTKIVDGKVVESTKETKELNDIAEIDTIGDAKVSVSYQAISGDVNA